MRQFAKPKVVISNIKVYSSASGAGAISKASGFFGGAVVNSFPDLAIEDEGRLRNFNIRDSQCEWAGEEIFLGRGI